MEIEVICRDYSKEQKEEWSKLIKGFNQLYHDARHQTWSITNWRGVGVLKAPTDLWIYQEIITDLKPDLIIETGSYHGGSALYMRDVLDKVYPEGEIISIDISHEELRKEARVNGVHYFLGSSVDVEMLARIQYYIDMNECERIMVILDSNHEESHVRRELDLYAPLVTVGSYLIVEDTSNSPGPIAAVRDWEKTQQVFRPSIMCERLMLTFNRDGYWIRSKE